MKLGSIVGLIWFLLVSCGCRVPIDPSFEHTEEFRSFDDIHEYIKTTIRYQIDEENIWKFPEDTYADKCGDCEDTALTWFLFRKRCECARGDGNMALVNGAGSGTTDWNFIYNEEARRAMQDAEEAYEQTLKDRKLRSLRESIEQGWEEGSKKNKGTKSYVVRGSLRGGFL